MLRRLQSSPSDLLDECIEVIDEDRVQGVPACSGLSSMKTERFSASSQTASVGPATKVGAEPSSLSYQGRARA